MRIVAVGSLATDYYYDGEKFIGACGGMSCFNVIANLASKFETHAVGVCGDDSAGKIAIQSLKDLGVNTDYVLTKLPQTKCYNVDIQNTKGSSYFKTPNNGTIEKWYEQNVEIEIPKNLLNQNSIIVLDTICDDIVGIATKTKMNGCINFIDIGHIGELRNMNNMQIIDSLSNKFDFIQLNNRVANYLVSTLNYNSTKELNELFNAKLLIITYGKDGTEFVLNGKSYFYKLEKPSEEVDPTGAGDLFFSVAIEHIIKSNFEVNKTIIDTIYKDAVTKTSELVKRIGARALVQPLYEIK